MRVTAVLRPYGSFRYSWELSVCVEAETPSELRDCEAWSQPHRRHVRAVPMADWTPPDRQQLAKEASPELFDKAVEVMLLFDRPFCFNALNADQCRYTYRLQLERTAIVDELVERLNLADHIDTVTVTIEALQLESEYQKLSMTSRRKSELHG